MKLCITAKGKDLESLVDPHFGRARYFLLIDPQTLAARPIENAPSAHGAGVQASQLMADQDVGAVLTGSVGPNAYQSLNAAGIAIHIGIVGTARDALAAYLSGTLATVAGPSSQGHGGGRS